MNRCFPRMEEVRFAEHGNEERITAGFRCIHCGHPLDKLLVQYSPGNIRLMKCENCRAVADEYIECEIMILLIDLILHKQIAYRHLLYNVRNHHAVDLEALFWKLILAFLVLDGLRILILYDSYNGCRAHGGSLFFVCGCVKMFLEVCLANILFISILYTYYLRWQNTFSKVARFREYFLAVLASSYFKLFLIIMVVWEFPSLVVYITEGFVFSSNVVALIVLMEGSMAECIGVCASAHASKWIISHLLGRICKLIC